MSIQNKGIILSFIVFCLYGLTGYVIQRQVVLPSFVALDRATATDNTSRVIEALNREVELLIPSATDWGTWDDTYQFMEDRNETFLTSNLNSTALESLKVNFLGLYDTEGLQVWGLGYDLEAEEQLNLGESFNPSAGSSLAFLGDPGSDATVAGLFPTAAGPLLVASRPILTSSGTGTPRGRVVVGRLLNDDALHRLENQARVRLIASPPTSGEPAAAGTAETSGNVKFTSIELRETMDITQGHSLIFDLTGVPILHFQVDTPRTILARGISTVYYAALYFSGGGMMVLLFLLLFLRHTVFNPVSRLINHVTQVGANDDLYARLEMNRKDEIGTLANEFNRMVGRLADARQKLLDQSFRYGVAEMAAGVLHNIGNAVTPLGVKVTAIKHDLQQASAAEMKMAVTELADPATPVERRGDLSKFIELSGVELASVIQRTVSEFEPIEAQLDHVQMILMDQQRFSQAKRTLEPLLPSRLLDEVVRLLSEEIQNIAHVEIDPGIIELRCVNASRIALQQVMNNLLINAAESIRETGQKADTGRIRIHGWEQNQHGQGFVHLCFEDNGAGISTDQLSQLFERGFSTKKRGSGLGLHWSANTITAMGGELWAESPGPGSGASMHLLLPFAQPTVQCQEAGA